MTTRMVAITSVLCLIAGVARGQETGTTSRVLTLREAVDLALVHNHAVRIAGQEVEQRQHAKDVARSAYFPQLRNDTILTHVTDTQLVEIPAGAFGDVSNNLIPRAPIILNQGGQTFFTSGMGLSQPLTQLLKIRAANDIARATLDASRESARDVAHQVTLKVQRLYYAILIAEVRHRAVASKIEASEELRTERVQQVKYGSALDADLIETRAQALQAKQDLLTIELQRADLHRQFNDTIGRPLTTDVALDAASIGTMPDSCPREECVKVALTSHPEVAEARATVEKASAATRLAQYEYVPDVEVFARYSYQRDVPFLASNFGTFGVHVSYDLFDGGRKRAALKERQAQLAQAKENLARVSDETELRVLAAFDKLERTRQMIHVSEELLALRTESRRVTAEQLTRGGVLPSQTAASVAQELEATAALLQSRLDYVQAADELDEAIGRK